MAAHCAIIMIVLSVSPVIVVELTPDNRILREWIISYCQTVFALWGLGMLVVVLIRTFTSKNKVLFPVLRLIVKVITGLLLFVFLYYAGCVYSWFFLEYRVKDYGETALVNQLNWLDKPEYAIYQKEGKFYMRWVRPFEIDVQLKPESNT